MEWLTNNIASILIFLGLALLAVEVVVLSFSIMVLFFIGLGCLITGLLIFMGIMPGTVVTAISGVAFFSIASAIILWKPLKRMQDDVEKRPVKGDLIGYSFILDSDISATEPGSHRYSGINWKIKSAEPIAAGTEVEVIKTDVGEFTVAVKS